MKESQNQLALINEEDLSLVNQNVLNGKQLDLILKKTPTQYVKTRPAKGGGTWKYVSGGYVRKVLNLMFGWQWSFEILEEKIIHKEVVVKGKLTCVSNGITIIKTQYGNKDIMFRKGTEEPLSIGNDMKAAATDCLKKCASEIGIAADIYNAEEFKEIRVKEKEDPIKKRMNKMLMACNSIEELELLCETNPDIDIELINIRKIQLQNENKM